ncbi:CDP-alcohol phosphatidyltransferase family protein [Natrialba sp. INN-245]|uniref:CDP-alcohol phosphatidyltransferase family protein n=1 Tax=Natrialba sp. INN-245 TaxID=2690967 RepID=UPI00130F7C3D|nr:CDP-alcohol phosphatidyltransferase family protein [Natrialba sp. INN-245]
MSDDSLATFRPDVRRRWGEATAGLLCAVFLAITVLEHLWAGGLALEFLVVVAVALALESLLVLVTIDRTSVSGTTTFTLATGVTIARAAAVAVLAGFVATRPPSGPLEWAPGALFAVAAALDAVDGAIARTTGTETDLGARLDVEVDAFVVFVGSILAVTAGAAPVAFLAVGIARYLFAGSLWWRQRRGRDVFELPPSRFRRPLGALAMLAIWLAILPVPGHGVSRAVTTIVLVPVLVNFVRDWLFVTGRD